MKFIYVRLNRMISASGENTTKKLEYYSEITAPKHFLENEYQRNIDDSCKGDLVMGYDFDEDEELFGAQNRVQTSV